MKTPAIVRHPDKVAFRRFWRFVNNRQVAYYRRFVKKTEAPWVKDPVLRDFFFTNVFRELDRGTLYLTETILPRYKKPQDKLFNIMVYRMFNHIPTYEFIYGDEDLRMSLHLGSWQWVDIEKALRKWQLEGNQVFTSAFTVTGSPFAGSTNKITNISYLISEIQTFLKDLGWWKKIWNAETMEDAWRQVKKIRGFGGFLAYEIVVDINYAHRKWGEDEFVNPGPGCRRGINILYPKVGAIRPTADHLAVIHYLHDTQRENLPKKFPYATTVPRDLTLRNIEHSLCEFQKYEKRRKGLRGGRARTFSPRRDPLPRKKG